MFYVAVWLCVGYDNMYFHFPSQFIYDSVSSSGCIILKALMLGGWWIGKDKKENCLGLLQNTIPGVAGVTEGKYEKGHNTQFHGWVSNHKSPDS